MSERGGNHLTWAAFENSLDELTGPDGTADGYAFRGHPNGAWRLQQSLHRAATADGRLPLPPAADLVELETHALKEFQAAAPSELPYGVIASTSATVDWWPIMQHYGAPTRLIDWTASPYAGAFFASRSHRDADGVLYFLHAPTLARKATAAFLRKEKPTFTGR